MRAADELRSEAAAITPEPHDQFAMGYVAGLLKAAHVLETSPDQPGGADELLLSPSQAAQLLNVPVRTLDGWRNRRIGPDYLKVGRHVRYRRTDLATWLDTQGGDAQ
jgi:excisionase family DNA binding protein